MRHILSPSAALFHADCRDALRQLPDNSIDSCVTDPPYALVSIMKRFGGANAAPAKGNDAYMRASAGFMGKTWDTGETAFSTEFWAEVLRVLKPGAHVVAFGASRGYHRMACAIEDAGFEIRDSLMWIYGSGFPKSHDVSKGIDKAAGAEREVIGEWNMPGRSKRSSEQKYGLINDSGFVTAPATDAAREWEGWGTALKPAFEPIVLARKPLSEPTVAANVLRWRTGALNIDACRVGTEGGTRGSNYAKTGLFGVGGKCEIAQLDAGRWPANVVHDGSDEVIGAFPNTNGSKRGVKDPITSFEPIVLARKPLSEPTVAANVLKWRTGALNIDASRIAAPDGVPVFHKDNKRAGNTFDVGSNRTGETSTQGRWPANVVHDGSDEVVGAFPNTGGSKTTVGVVRHGRSGGIMGKEGALRDGRPEGHDDPGGSAARFFYSAKASKQDRNGSKHPTVKPISLMEWLCTLITPPGGTVLDPFAGSGTTGIAAQNKGFQVVLCEREAEYVTDIKARFAGSIPASGSISLSCQAYG